MHPKKIAQNNDHLLQSRYRKRGLLARKFHDLYLCNYCIPLCGTIQRTRQKQCRIFRRPPAGPMGRSSRVTCRTPYGVLCLPHHPLDSNGCGQWVSTLPDCHFPGDGYAPRPLPARSPRSDGPSIRPAVLRAHATQGRAARTVRSQKAAGPGQSARGRVQRWKTGFARIRPGH